MEILTANAPIKEPNCTFSEVPSARRSLWHCQRHFYTRNELDGGELFQQEYPWFHRKCKPVASQICSPATIDLLEDKGMNISQNVCQSKAL